MLLMKRAELEVRLSDDQSRLARVEQRLYYIEREEAMESEIVLKDVAEQRIAAISTERPGLRFDTSITAGSRTWQRRSSLWRNGSLLPA
jgi:hypothetical protein